MAITDRFYAHRISMDQTYSVRPNIFLNYLKQETKIWKIRHLLTDVKCSDG
jgi:hypothetical protein